MEEIQKGKIILPKGLDLENTYNLFSLFILELIWKIIVVHINLYADFTNTTSVNRDQRP